MKIQLTLEWDYPKLRERLISAFNESKLSVKDLVYQAGLSKSSEWYGIIHGNRIDWDTLYRLCYALGINDLEFLPTDLDAHMVGFIESIRQRNEGP